MFTAIIFTVTMHWKQINAQCTWMDKENEISTCVWNISILMR